jgi:hypothetical protein
MNTTKLASLKAAAEKKHTDVCDLHCDESVMLRDGTCGECADDYHEAELLSR